MKLYVVGIGSGNENGLTYEARRTLEEADIIVGYTVYAVCHYFHQSSALEKGCRG